MNVQGGGDAPFTTNKTGTAAILIHGQGAMEVPNPAYEGPLAPAPYNQPTITRNYGFGTTQGSVTFNGTALTITQWNQNLIRATTPVCGKCVVHRPARGRPGRWQEVGQHGHVHRQQRDADPSDRPINPRSRPRSTRRRPAP